MDTSGCGSPVVPGGYVQRQTRTQEINPAGAEPKVPNTDPHLLKPSRRRTKSHVGTPDRRFTDVHLGIFSRALPSQPHRTRVQKFTVGIRTPSRP